MAAQMGWLGLDIDEPSLWPLSIFIGEIGDEASNLGYPQKSGKTHSIPKQNGRSTKTKSLGDTHLGVTTGLVADFRAFPLKDDFTDFTSNKSDANPRHFWDVGLNPPQRR